MMLLPLLHNNHVNYIALLKCSYLIVVYYLVIDQSVDNLVMLAASTLVDAQGREVRFFFFACAQARLLIMAAL